VTDHDATAAATAAATGDGGGARGRWGAGRLGTIRTRLTVLYSGLFLLTSTILLVVTNLLLRSVLRSKVTAITATAPVSDGAAAPGMSIGSGLPGSSALPGGSTMTGGGAPPSGGAVFGGSGSVSGTPGSSGSPDFYLGRLAVVDRLPDSVLHYQWTVAAITIGALALVSVAAGWWLAGRLLRPLHQITATAHRLSLSNLHERIALAGPHDELRDLADTFDEMLCRLEAAVDAQRRFIANAAHELRTPLALQRAAIQIGLTDPAPERIPLVRTQLLAANQRTERLIDALLLLAQTERGLAVLEPVALDTLVRQVAHETPSPDITLTVEAEPVVVFGDAVLLARLIGNLLDNAVRHNYPGGSAAVRMSSGGVLTVRNTGPVVPNDCLAEIFEPFRRLHSPRTGSATGSGLGLSIARSIASVHRATLTATPNPGGGLLLTTHFPTSVAPLMPRPAPPMSAIRS